MFCFQCEQTAGCAGCTRSGVCGKTPAVSALQDKLTGAAITLAGKNVSGKDELLVKSLFTTITNVNFNEETITELINEVHALSGDINDYDMSLVWDANEDIRSLKSLILFGVRGMAAYAYHAKVLGYEDANVNAFFSEALMAVGSDKGIDELLFCEIFLSTPMAHSPTAKAVRAPSVYGSAFAPEKSSSGSFRTHAPSIAGRQITNESRSASFRESEQSRPAAIVAPERESPGKTARAWKKPIPSA